MKPHWIQVKVKYLSNWLIHFKGIVCHFGKYAYSLYCQELDEKMISLMISHFVFFPSSFFFPLDVLVG